MLGIEPLAFFKYTAVKPSTQLLLVSYILKFFFENLFYLDMMTCACNAS